MIKVKTTRPQQKIHVLDLIKIEGVKLREDDRKIGDGFHILLIDTSIFKDKIIDLVETGNTQERIEEQKRDWEVPSYNTLGDVSRQTHHYSLFTDDEGNVSGITLLTERVCPFCLNWAIELVYQSN